MHKSPQASESQTIKAPKPIHHSQKTPVYKWVPKQSASIPISNPQLTLVAENKFPSCSNLKHQNSPPPEIAMHSTLTLNHSQVLRPKSSSMKSQPTTPKIKILPQKITLDCNPQQGQTSLALSSRSTIGWKSNLVQQLLQHKMPQHLVADHFSMNPLP